MSVLAKFVLAACLVAGALIAQSSGPAQALQCHVGTITFYPEGGIKSCEIEANHRFYLAGGRRIVCRHGHLLTQHPGGELEGCTLAEAYRDGAATCEAGRRVALEPDGRIRACE